MALTAPKRLRDAITKVCSVRVRSLGAITTYLRAANATDVAEWAVNRKRNKELKMEKSARSSCSTTHAPCRTLPLRRLFFFSGERRLMSCLRLPVFSFKLPWRHMVLARFMCRQGRLKEKTGRRRQDNRRQIKSIERSCSVPTFDRPQITPPKVTS